MTSAGLTISSSVYIDLVHPETDRLQKWYITLLQKCKGKYDLMMKNITKV